MDMDGDKGQRHTKGTYGIDVFAISRKRRMELDRMMDKQLLEEIRNLRKSVEQLEGKVDTLTQKLDRHINFIDETYEGLKNPINAARKWLGR